jgi:hypothetical protein
MDAIVKQGRVLFAVAITAFGVQNLICARLGSEFAASLRFQQTHSSPTSPALPFSRLV